MTLVRRQFTETPSRPLAMGHTIDRVESGAMRLATQRMYRFSQDHRLLYTILAFMLGAAAAAIVIAFAYRNWAFEGVNFSAGIWEIIAGLIGAGLVSVVAAFAYVRTIRPTLDPMVKGGIIQAGE
jgi:uncharacterized membrane protein YdcZ (DUF606 family)